MKKLLLLLIFMSALLFPGCSTFIPDEEIDKLKVYEEEGGVYTDYVLLQEIHQNEIVLPAGTKVRLVVVAGDDWIKVYAYRAEEDLLKSMRVLVLIMFDDEFTDEEFDEVKFDAELSKVVRKYDEKDSTVNKNRKKNKDKRIK